MLRDVVQINPEHKRAWGYLGLALQKLGELEQAQIAFEKGDRPTMARKITEFRRSLAPPPPDSQPIEIARGVRDMAQAAFSELDAGELRFALAEPAPYPLGDAHWHTLELGGSSKRRTPPPKSPFSKTLPPPWMGELEPEPPTLPPPSIAFSVPPVHHGYANPRAAALLPFAPATAAPGPAHASDRVLLAAPPLLASQGDLAVARHPSGVVVVQAGEDVARAFAGRLDALRVVAGNVTTRVLHRRTREAETNEILGGIGNPLVRIAGDAQVVLGARPGHALALLEVDDDLAFVREELLVGFELALQYENGRVALELGGAEGVPVVQLRGSGTLVLEVAGELARLPSTPGKPLLVRRDWVVGWFGRLVTRALPSTESPGGHRGLLGFSGEGTVLVCVG